MARVDDYENAKKIAVEALAQRSARALAEDGGYGIVGGDTLEIPFLNRFFLATYPDFAFSDKNEPEKPVPIQEQVLILHYLLGDPITEPAGDWAAYREIPGASFYTSAFVKRAIDPIKNVFGADPESMKKVAPLVGGHEFEGPGDACFEFSPFPRVPVRIILYAGDEEFPPEASILFDRSVGRIISPEDMAWLAGMIVYRMAALKPR